MNGKGLLLACALAGVVAVPGLASAAPAHRATNSTTFQASLPEDALSPAITNVVVSNDDDGIVTFQVNIGNRPQISNSDHYGVFLDTDSNVNTGDVDADGAEYAIAIDDGRADLGKWNGSSYDFGVSQTSLVFTYTGGPTLKIAAADLGNPKGFEFYVAALTDDAAGGDPHRDFAPPTGHGDWSYQIGIAPLSLSVTSFKTAPAKPKSGKPFGVTMQVSANRSNALTQGVQVSCTAKVAGKTLKPKASSFGAAVANCGWALPASAKAKLLSGTVTVTYQGVAATRHFSARVG